MFELFRQVFEDHEMERTKLSALPLYTTKSRDVTLAFKYLTASYHKS